MTSTVHRYTSRVLALTTLAWATSIAAAFAEPPAKSKGNGAQMSVSGVDSTGCIWSYVYASRTGTTAAPQTWMSYDVYNGCSREWIASGHGLVPNTTLKVTNKVTLSLTPSANSNFYLDGATGSIQLTLTPNGVSSYRYSGHSRSEFMEHVYQSHGSWSEASASVSGHVLGFAAGNMSGWFGEGRDRYMEIDRGSK